MSDGDGFDEHFRRAHEEARVRLVEGAEAVFEDGPGDNLSAPFCGCDTCVVREVIDAAYVELQEHFLAKFEERVGFKIHFGQPL